MFLSFVPGLGYAQEKAELTFVPEGGRVGVGVALEEESESVHTECMCLEMCVACVSCAPECCKHTVGPKGGCCF